MNAFYQIFKEFYDFRTSKRIDCVFKASYESGHRKCFPIFLHVINANYKMFQLCFLAGDYMNDPVVSKLFPNVCILL